MGARFDLVVVIGQIDHLLSVGRDVREPGIHIRIEGHLRLVLAVGLHFPNLHAAGPHAVEPDGFSVGAEFGTVIEPGRIGQPFFGSALERHHIDVLFHLRSAEGAVGGQFAVEADPMQVTGAERRDPPGFAAFEGDDIDIGIIGTDVGRIVAAKADPAAVGRHHVVVVALDDGSCINFLQIRGSVGSQFEQPPVFVDDQPFPVGRPVGRLDHIGKRFDHPVGAGFDIEDFQVAVVGLRMLSGSRQGGGHGKED